MSDYPDWGPATYQPRFGGVKEAINKVVVAANATTELVGVSGRGIIRFCNMYITNTPRNESGISSLYIDGVEYITVSFENKRLYALNMPISEDWFLLMYDTVNGNYSLAVQGIINFDESFALKYIESEGNTPNVTGFVLYSVVS